MLVGVVSAGVGFMSGECSGWLCPGEVPGGLCPKGLS